MKALIPPARTEELYQDDAGALYRRVDKMFLWLLFVEWIFAVILAAVSTRPGTSELHVRLAVILGGLLNVLPVVLIYTRPGALSTRLALSAVQGLWSALLIHLSGGRIETHFHIFGSLAMLAFYRDWRALVPATVVVVLDHFLRGLYLPESIYGVSVVARWRFLEHTGWVAFEDLFLIISCVASDRELREKAARAATMEVANELLEEQRNLVERRVEERTAQLAASQAQYKAVLEASNTVPWEFDPERGAFTYMAPQVERYCGWPATDFAEPGFLMSKVHTEDRLLLRNGFRDARPGIDNSVEYRFARADGSWSNVRGDFTVQTAPSGKVVFRGFTKDITEQRQLELELRAAQKLESVGRLAAGVAHEINTPIQFVSDSIHFIRDALGDLLPLLAEYRGLEEKVAAGGAQPEDASRLAEARDVADLDYVSEHLPRAIGRSLEGLGRVADIVRSMKEFAHPDQKEMVTVDLNRAVESTLTIARSEYKLVADVELHLGEIPQVTCYAGEVNQVLLNIIVNAAHAIGDVVRGTEKRGTIRIETAHEADSVVVSISDTGGGIPEAIRDRIFEPFFTTKEVGKGTGQGLAIARAVVQDKHGGKLSFTSEQGVGTTFVIRLPVEGKDAPKSGPALEAVVDGPALEASAG